MPGKEGEGHTPDAGRAETEEGKGLEVARR